MASSTWFLSTGHRFSGICSRDLVCRYTESSMVPQMSCCIWSKAPLPMRTGPGVVVAGEVIEFLLDQAAFTADAVHHLQRMAFAVVGARHVGDEREEVVGLAVQAQRVEAPQRERRVAHPGVAVVPVAFALRGFRQRCGARGQQRAGRRVRQALQRQRAALQVRPPRVIREVADVDPLPPALAGLPHLVGGFLEGLRRRMLGPAQRDEHVVALGQPGAGARLVALQAEPQVGGQPQRRVRIGVARARAMASPYAAAEYSQVAGMRW